MEVNDAWLDFGTEEACYVLFSFVIGLGISKVLCSWAFEKFMSFVLIILVTI